MGNNLVSLSEEDAAAVYLLEQTMAFTYQAALRAAAVLGIADYLKEGAKTASELAKDVNVDAKNLFRVMRMLASKKIFQEIGDGRFSLTPAAEFLLTDAPRSLRSAVLMLTDETFWSPLATSLKACAVSLLLKIYSVRRFTNIGRKGKIGGRGTIFIPVCLQCPQWRILFWFAAMISLKMQR